MGASKFFQHALLPRGGRRHLVHGEHVQTAHARFRVGHGIKSRFLAAGDRARNRLGGPVDAQLTLIDVRRMKIQSADIVEAIARTLGMGRKTVRRWLRAVEGERS